MWGSLHRDSTVFAIPFSVVSPVILNFIDLQRVENFFGKASGAVADALKADSSNIVPLVQAAYEVIITIVVFTRFLSSKEPSMYISIHIFLINLFSTVVHSFHHSISFLSPENFSNCES